MFILKYIEANFYYLLNKIGFGYVPVEIISNNRVTICKDCSYYNKEENKCNACGCFLQLKTRLIDESCPKGEW